jgi:hypothetical protein
MPELHPLPTYTVRVRRIDPTLAELHIVFEGLPADVDVRGRLMGPRCPGASTIEVAYHLHRVAFGDYRVLIPEPVYWSPERPFVYEGPAEFSRQGQPAGTLWVSVGLRRGREE